MTTPAAPHPDRNFATIACGRGDAARVLARLEFGTVCALLTAEAAGRAFCACAAQAPLPGLEARQTLPIDDRGRFDVPPLRAWLASPRAQGGCLRAVLNRGAGPYLCRPLQMGADVVVEDLSDLTGGAMRGAAVAARTQGALEAFLRLSGADAAAQQASPDLQERLATWLPLLALETQARSDRALVAAQYLSCHPLVAWVSYPGLAADASNDMARRALEHGFGWRVAFGLAQDVPQPSLDLWGEGARRPHGSSLEALGERAVLLNCGLEEALDIVGALETAVAGAQRPCGDVS